MKLIDLSGLSKVGKLGIVQDFYVMGFFAYSFFTLGRREKHHFQDCLSLGQIL